MKKPALLIPMFLIFSMLFSTGALTDSDIGTSEDIGNPVYEESQEPVGSDDSDIADASDESSYESITPDVYKAYTHRVYIFEDYLAEGYKMFPDVPGFPDVPDEFLEHFMELLKRGSSEMEHIEFINCDEYDMIRMYDKLSQEEYGSIENIVSVSYEEVPLESLSAEEIERIKSRNDVEILYVRDCTVTVRG